MTKEFEKIVNRLARARNFEDGSFLLITAEPDKEQAMVEMKGDHEDLVTGMGTALSYILSEIDDYDALAVRELLTKIIISDEQRRFQASSEEVKSE